MNKKIIALAVFGVLAFSGITYAQNQTVLPSAGLTPESSFYFIDKLGESLREFFTFNPEGKARLQITFAAERVAEIKVILKDKGVDAKGLEIAQSRLQAHLANAATIVLDQKSEGKDVSALAKELDDDFEGPKSALEQTFKEQKRTLEAQEKELKRKILEARRAGDTAQAENLIQQLGQAKAQKELLELKEEEAEEVLDQEEGRIEEEMKAREKAEKAIRDAEEEKRDVIDEASEDELTIPAEAFGKFDNLLGQAKSAFAAGNFAEAKRLAEQAEESLEAVEEVIENLEAVKEKEEELKQKDDEQQQEAEGKLKEANKEEAEKIKEESKQEEERIKEEETQVEEKQKDAEEKLQEDGQEEGI